MDPINIRLSSQQLLSPQFSTPTEVVAHFGALQAQEYRMMRWAVSSRTKEPSFKAFVKAYNSGEIIRAHLLRCTWQLVTAEDYDWMLSLCRTKSLSILKGWMHSNRIYIEEDERRLISDVLTQCVSDLGSATKEDLSLSLKSKGVVLDEHRLSYHIRLAELNGLIVSGNIHPTKPTYALKNNKLSAVGTIDRDEALMLLTRKYFQSHSPATLEDFVWWSGLNISDCKRGIYLLSSELLLECYNNRTFYLHDSCSSTNIHDDNFLLLSPYDEYLIGYKSRDIVIDPQFSHCAHNNSGIFYPILVENGVVSGNWKPFEKVFSASAFLPNTDVDNWLKSWERYQKYLNE